MAPKERARRTGWAGTIAAAVGIATILVMLYGAVDMLFVSEAEARAHDTNGHEMIRAQISTLKHEAQTRQAVLQNVHDNVLIIGTKMGYEEDLKKD